MKRFLAITLLATSAIAMMADHTILDIKHSLTDDNVVPPESFEVQSTEMVENFYLNNYIAQDDQPTQPTTATAKDYEERLKRLPTEIELPYNSVVGKFIDMYLTKRRGMVSDLLSLHNYYGPIFLEELVKEGLPTELQYLPVVESALNPNAVSKDGAAGLWQFMPNTATGLGMEVNSLVDERRDARLSSRNAARYLKQLHDIYNDWTLAIAAYNCGTSNVNKAIRRAGDGKKDFWQIYPYLPQETRGYVPAFIAANYIMNYYRSHGIRPTVVKRQLLTDTVKVDKYVNFNQIANVLNLPLDEIRMLNPQYRKDIIPGDYRPYTLTLPRQQCLSYIMSEPKILEYESDLYARRSFVEPVEPSDTLVAQASPEPVANVAAAATVKTVRKTHVVARGESIRDIAHQYGVSATDIKRWNNLRRGKVKEGDELVLNVTEKVEQPKALSKQLAQTTTAADRNAEPAVKSTPAASTQSASTRKNTSEKQNVKSTKDTKAKKETAKKKEPKAPTNHTVKNGESLDKIARSYGVTVGELQAANGMKKGDAMIHAGDKLKLPAKAKAAKETTKASSKKKGKAGSSKKTSKKGKSKKSRRR